METVFEAVFAVGFLVVLGSAGALLAGRIGSRALRWSALPRREGQSDDPAECLDWVVFVLVADL